MAKKQAITFPAAGKVDLSAANFNFEPTDLGKVTKFYENKLKTETTVGSGVLKYTGTASGDGAIFIGENKQLGTAVIRFSGAETSALLQEFLTVFVGNAENHAPKSLNLVSITGTIGLQKPKALVDTDQLNALFNQFINSQNDSKAKTLIEGNTLWLGGKSSQMNVSVVGVTPEPNKRLIKKSNITNSTTIINIGATFKIQETKAKALFETMKSNSAVSVVSLVSFFLLELVNKYNMTSTIDKIRDTLNKNSEGQNISMPVAKEFNKTLSKEGQYVSKSLAGVRNKLVNELTTKETKLVFLHWAESLKAKNVIIEDKADFFTKIATIFANEDS